MLDADSERSKDRPHRISLTAGSIIGLLVGLFAGVFVHGSKDPALLALSNAIEPLGTIWVGALQMIVIPLVVAHLLAAIVSTRSAKAIGGLGGITVALFVVFLLLGALYTVILAPPIVGTFTIDAQTIASLQASTSIPPSAIQADQNVPTFTQWLMNLIPTNPLRAAVNGDILPVLVFTVLFALAVTRIAPEPRQVMGSLFQGVAEAMLVLVRWILWLMPIGVFALAFSLAVQTGTDAARILAFFVVVVCGLLFVFTLALYPVAIVVGRVSPKRFAKSVAPAQVIAVSTRSSIASLPALIEGARTHLRLPPPVSGFVLPLAVSTFKVNRTISSTVKLFFVAHLFGIHLGTAEIATFVATVVILSFSSLGIPGEAAPFKTLPAYLAAGLPIEGVVLFVAVDAIPDIFKTLVNVTGDMTAATILARFVEARSPASAVASSVKLARQ